MKPLKRLKRVWKSRVTDAGERRRAVICESPTFILGAPKSGTTAIAQLLSRATGQALTSDFQRAISRPSLQAELACRLISFDEFVEQYRLEFSRPLIKEPFLSFHLDDLRRRFPAARFVGIVRNPFQNIRSILNRLRVPGDLERLDFEEWEELRKVRAWRMSLQSELIGRPTSSYIEAMAYRWAFACRALLENPSSVICIRYEDFLVDKKAFIERLAEQLNLTVVNDIADSVDVQFQRKGDRGVDVNAFFGEANYARIQRITGDVAARLGYRRE